jgi:hypothetical protein
MLADLRRVAAEQGGYLTLRTYLEHGQFSKIAIIETWHRWAAALEAAGLALTKAQRKPSMQDGMDYGRRVARQMVVKQCKRCDGPYTGNKLDETEIWCAVCRHTIRHHMPHAADGWEYEHCSVEWRI